MDGVSFREMTRYDICKDCEVVTFMGVTSAGTYYTELPESTKNLRELRNEFRVAVVDTMRKGIPPCKIEIEEEDNGI